VNRPESFGALLVWILFAALTYQVVTHGPLTGIDAAAMAWATTHRTTMLTRAAYWVSETGGPSITAVYAALLVVVLLTRRRWASALAVGFIVYVAIALNVVVKDWVHRGRPVMEDPLVHLVTYSFPSGHAAASTVFGGLSMMLWARSHGSSATAIGSAAILVWIAAVCGSRIYLGAHYPTDVAGGVLEGTGWVLLCSLAVRRWHIPLAWSEPSR